MPNHDKVVEDIIDKLNDINYRLSYCLDEEFIDSSLIHVIEYQGDNINEIEKKGYAKAICGELHKIDLITSIEDDVEQYAEDICRECTAYISNAFLDYGYNKYGYEIEYNEEDNMTTLFKVRDD